MFILDGRSQLTLNDMEKVGPPDRCEFIFSGTPATSGDYTFAPWLY